MRKLSEKKIIDIFQDGLGNGGFVPEDVEFFKTGKKYAVVKVDTLVESTDVPPGTKLEDLARKSLVSCISDFAAKGVKPVFGIISLVIPKKYTKLKMICTNPDLIVHHGSRSEYCAGTLALTFEELGGKVVYFGKPYPEIYNFCIKKNETILVIGDNIRTDIRGANNMKFDSLLVTDGIHKDEFINLPIEDYDKILEKYKTKTNYYQERLTW